MSKKLVLSLLIVFIIFSMCIPAFANDLPIELSYDFYNFGKEYCESPSFTVSEYRAYSLSVYHNQDDPSGKINVYLYNKSTGSVVRSLTNVSSYQTNSYVWLRPNTEYYVYVSELNSGQGMSNGYISIQ